MIQVHAIKSTAKRFQSDQSGRALTLSNARYHRSAASFDGGLVS